jgi:hypothetical protein
MEMQQANDWLTGKNLINNYNYSAFDIAKLCDEGSLKAYSRNDKTHILASSECIKKFINPYNSKFCTISSDKSCIIINDFDCKYIGISKNHHRSFADNDNISIKEFNDKFNKIYIEKYKQCLGDKSPSETGKIFYVLLGECEDTDLSIKKLKCDGSFDMIREKISIIKIKDDCGSHKYIFNKYNDNYITLYYNLDILNMIQDKIIIDNGESMSDIFFSEKYRKYRNYIVQEGMNYFRKNENSYKYPLKHNYDYFIFDFDTFKKRFYFNSDENFVKDIFASEIKKMFFRKSEFDAIRKLKDEEEAIKLSLIDYLNNKCTYLMQVNKHNQSENEVISIYKLALQGYKWKEIYEIIYNKKKSNNPDSDISKKIVKFKGIAMKYKIPFINPRELKTNNPSKLKELSDDAIKQLNDYYKRIMH